MGNQSVTYYTALNRAVKSATARCANYM